MYVSCNIAWLPLLILLVNTFWCYVMPIVGAWIADEFWGRLKTIQTAIGFAMVGHIILIVSALPPVISNHPNGALGCFALGLIIFGIGTGGFKYLTLHGAAGIELTMLGRISRLSLLNSTKRPGCLSKRFPKPASVSSWTHRRLSRAFSSISTS